MSHHQRTYLPVHFFVVPAAKIVVSEASYCCTNVNVMHGLLSAVEQVSSVAAATLDMCLKLLH